MCTGRREDVCSSRTAAALHAFSLRCLATVSLGRRVCSSSNKCGDTAPPALHPPQPSSRWARSPAGCWPTTPAPMIDEGRGRPWRAGGGCTPVELAATAHLQRRRSTLPLCACRPSRPCWCCAVGACKPSTGDKTGFWAARFPRHLQSEMIWAKCTRGSHMQRCGGGGGPCGGGVGRPVECAAARRGRGRPTGQLLLP